MVEPFEPVLYQKPGSNAVSALIGGYTRETEGRLGRSQGPGDCVGSCSFVSVPVIPNVVSHCQMAASTSTSFWSGVPCGSKSSIPRVRPDTVLAAMMFCANSGRTFINGSYSLLGSAGSALRTKGS